MDIRKIAIIVGVVLALFGLALIPFVPGPQVEIGVTLRDHQILVAQSAVRAGDRVTLKIRNEGTEIHELEVEGYDIEVEEIRPGQIKTLTFTAKKAGSFELVCRMPGHFEKGMYTPFLVLK